MTLTRKTLSISPTSRKPTSDKPAAVAAHKKRTQTTPNKRPQQDTLTHSQKKNVQRTDKPRKKTHTQTTVAAKPTSRIAERLHIGQIRVDGLPSTALAAHLSWAAHCLVAIEQGQSLQHIWPALHIDAAARPNTQRLVFDALRHWASTELWLDKAIANEPTPWVNALLCVALTQLHLQDNPAFTIVNEAVRAVEQHSPFAKNMVNAVLRRYGRETELWQEWARTNEMAQYNHPQWWIDTLKQQYPQQWLDILQANNQRAPMSLRVNSLRYHRDDYLRLLAEQGILASLSPMCAQSIILHQPCAIEQLPEFFTGAVSVQDVGAQCAAQLLDVHSGMRVLDACAAPGGKTAHILELCPNVELLALEKDAARAARIDETLQRLQLNATVCVTDANNVHQWWDGKPFERILLDAPCSASGIVRRHPDIRWLRQPEDLPALAAQQAQLLRAMWKVLAEDGLLVYCTCSIFTQEGTEVIEQFLQHTPNAQLQPIAQQNTPYGWQLLPTLHSAQNNPIEHSAWVNHDGFFYAVLKKTTTQPS